MENFETLKFREKESKHHKTLSQILSPGNQRKYKKKNGLNFDLWKIPCSGNVALFFIKDVYSENYFISNS